MSAASRPFRGSEAGLRRNRSSNKPVVDATLGRDGREANLRRVYGSNYKFQTAQDEHGNDMLQSHGPPARKVHQEVDYHTRRGQSGRPGGRLEGLETIYMSKIPKLKPSMNMNVT